jgi:hypothetical protein
MFKIAHIPIGNKINPTTLLSIFDYFQYPLKTYSDVISTMVTSMPKKNQDFYHSASVGASSPKAITVFNVIKIIASSSSHTPCCEWLGSYAY